MLKLEVILVNYRCFVWKMYTKVFDLIWIVNWNTFFTLRTAWRKPYKNCCHSNESMSLDFHTFVHPFNNSILCDDQHFFPPHAALALFMCIMHVCFREREIVDSGFSSFMCFCHTLNSRFVSHTKTFCKEIRLRE